MSGISSKTSEKTVVAVKKYAAGGLKSEAGLTDVTVRPSYVLCVLWLRGLYPCRTVQFNCSRQLPLSRGHIS